MENRDLIMQETVRKVATMAMTRYVFRLVSLARLPRLPLQPIGQMKPHFTKHPGCTPLSYTFGPYIHGDEIPLSGAILPRGMRAIRCCGDLN